MIDVVDTFRRSAFLQYRGGPLTDLAVFVVDDDLSVCQSIALLAKTMGANSQTFPSAEAFLEGVTSQPRGCLITDVRMLGMSGVQLLDEVAARGWKLPTIVVTAHADVRLAMQVVRAGAMTLLEKPYQNEELWKVMAEALCLSKTLAEANEFQSKFLDRLESLSSEELIVMREMLHGVPNKNIARDLDIAPRTLDLRRHSVLKKMEAQSAIQILHMFHEAGISPDETLPTARARV